MADDDQHPPLDLLEGSALLLDFDGTLVELAERPDLISVPDRLSQLLRRLKERLGGRLAIVTGRSLESLGQHLDCSAIAVSGSHGAELRFAGAPAMTVATAPIPDIVREEARRFAEEHGLLIEQKPAGMAIHYRTLPEEAERVRGFISALAERTGLDVQEGKQVAELRPHGLDKGEALRRIMKEPPFAGARPIFMGDDLTDEHAFEAAAILGGAGILVGPRSASAARWRLASVDAAMRWLEEAANV
jgi:trehalose 6-phosphate phosphatase